MIIRILSEQKKFITTVLSQITLHYEGIKAVTFFSVRGPSESTLKRSRRIKDSNEQSVLHALQMYKKRGIKIVSAI